MEQSRRRFLVSSAAILTAAGAAGCLDRDTSNPGGYAAFYTLEDWSQSVAGDVMEFTNPVPLGRIGHGWEPNFTVATEIADSEVFVYLDTPEFSWAQNAVETLERDYPEVEVVNVLEGVDLLHAERSFDPTHHHDDHVHIEEVYIIDRAHDEEVADLHGDHWHGSLPSVEVGHHVSLGAIFIDDHGDEIPLGDDHEFTLYARMHEDHSDGAVHIHGHGDHIQVEGEAPGHVELIIELRHDDHAEWASPPVGIDVTGEHDDGHDDDHDHDHDDDHDHVHIGDLELIDRDTEQVIADTHGDHWHGGLPEIELGSYRSIGGRFVDTDGHEIDLGQTYTMDASVMAGESSGSVSIESHGDHVHIHGEELGRVDIVFQLIHEDHVEWESPAIAASVVEEAGEPSIYADPHAWVDPIRAQQMIDNIAVGLARVDPDNAETFFDSADVYMDELEDLHDTFESELADRERDVVVLAGHDSFQYLADRYDFEIYTPVGVSPDASPGPNDISEAIDVIDEFDVDVVLTDIFEADDLAETIVEHSDATEILEVSPVEATTEEWLDNGWGYIEQMKEINLPAFKAALGAQ